MFYSRFLCPSVLLPVCLPVCQHTHSSVHFNGQNLKLAASQNVIIMRILFTSWKDHDYRHSFSSSFFMYIELVDSIICDDIRQQSRVSHLCKLQIPAKRKRLKKEDKNISIFRSVQERGLVALLSDVIKWHWFLMKFRSIWCFYFKMIMLHKR